MLTGDLTIENDGSHPGPVKIESDRFPADLRLRLLREAVSRTAERPHPDEPSSHTARIVSSTLWSIVRFAFQPWRCAKVSDPNKFTDD